MLEKTVVFGCDNSIDKIFGDLVIMDILPMRFLEENPYFVLAVFIVDRAFHGEDFFNIVLADLFTRIQDNQPEKGGRACYDAQDC
jgi:hypothetical protein